MGRLDPTSREPLLPLVLDSIGEGDLSDGGGDGGKVDLSFYLGASRGNDADEDGGGSNDAGGNAQGDRGGSNGAKDVRLAEFWDEAHSLSCLRRGTLHSTVEAMCRDAVGTSSSSAGENDGDGRDGGEERARRLDFVHGVVEGGCALIAGDGSVANDREDGKEFKSLRFLRGAEGSISSGLAGATDDQIEGAARLTAEALARGPSRAHSAASRKKSSVGSKSEDDATASSESRGGWLSYITTGVSHVIDRALNAYDGEDDHFDPGVSELDDANLLASDAGSISNSVLYHGVDDVVAMRNGGATATTAAGVDELLGSKDEVICIQVVASACKMLLHYAQDQCQEGAKGGVFSLGSDRSVERTILRLRGWDSHSFGSFCRRAGRHFAADENNARRTGFEKEKSTRLGEILGGISEREVCLLASTLCRSNFALIEKDETITLFPGGIPSGFESSQSDHALFQIHVTKHAIQHRMACLERNANTAKANAVKAQRNKMTSLAIVHLRRRKAISQEMERCAGVLANLDAAELRLERARDNTQLVQSYGMVRAALKDARASREGLVGGLGGEEGVEALVSDLREDMEEVDMLNKEMGAIGKEAILPGGVIDEEELNEELRRLELECEQEERLKEVVSDPERTPEAPVGGAGWGGSEEIAAQPMARQEQEDTGADVDATKKAEAVAA